MRTRDRIVSVAALGLALGLTPGFAFEGTTRPPAELSPAAPAISRAVQSDVPRPPGMIPRVPAPRRRHRTGVGGRRRRDSERRIAAAARAGSVALRARHDARQPSAAAADRVRGAVHPDHAVRGAASGTRALKDGQKQKALVSLEYAAEQGMVAAQWKLGRMYAEGDGVDQSDLRAFEYFRRIADGHADDNPVGPARRAMWRTRSCRSATITAKASPIRT